MAAPLDQDEDELLREDDLYSLLNVRRQASTEEINKAYKQLSKLYHPDKHLHPVKKKTAEHVFSKLKRAHEVLSDEHKRVVYNLYGERGLETYGKEVISRTKTPAEIIAEYERFKEEQEERRLQQKTNPKSSVMIAVNATEIFERAYLHTVDDETDDIPGFLPSVEVSTLHINQQVECPLTSQNTVTLLASVTAENGRGSGIFKTVWRRLLANRATLEVESSIGSRPNLTFRFSKLLFRRCFANFHTKLQVVQQGVGMTMGTGVNYNFDEHWQGRLRYNFLAPTSLSSSLIYNSNTQHFMLQVMLSIRNSFMFASYTRRFVDSDSSASVSLKDGHRFLRNGDVPDTTFTRIGPVYILESRVGTMSYMAEVGVEKKITSFSTVGAAISVGVPSGVIVRLKLERGQHVILMPISLSEEIVPSAIFYGTVVPLMTYFAVKKLIIDPYITDQKQKDLEKKKQEQQEKIHTRKREAEAFVELMQETVARSVEVEERKAGLVILKALYGKLTSTHTMELESEDCIDVTVPLQALVKESKLISPEMTSKSSLPGFYDPCLGEEKRLYIKYRFRRKLHHVTLQDSDSIRLPQQKHMLREEELPAFSSLEEEDT